MLATVSLHAQLTQPKPGWVPPPSLPPPSPPLSPPGRHRLLRRHPRHRPRFPIRARAAWRPTASNLVPPPALRSVPHCCRCRHGMPSSGGLHCHRGRAALASRPQRSQSAPAAAAATTSGLASRRPTRRQPSPDGTTSTAPAHGEPLRSPLWNAVPLLWSLRSPNRLRPATPPEVTIQQMFQPIHPLICVESVNRSVWIGRHIREESSVRTL